MAVLDRWDRRNQGWAEASIRDPDRPTGVWVIGVLGVVYAVATAIALAMGAWVVAGVTGVKAQVFLTVTIFVELRARQRASQRRPGPGSSSLSSEHQPRK